MRSELYHSFRIYLITSRLHKFYFRENSQFPHGIFRYLFSESKVSIPGIVFYNNSGVLPKR